jgi:hypothetical protein
VLWWIVVDVRTWPRCAIVDPLSMRVQGCLRFFESSVEVGVEAENNSERNFGDGERGERNRGLLKEIGYLF